MGPVRAHLEHVAADSGSSFRFLHRRADRLRYNPHHHHLYELICHRDGHGAVFIADRIAAYSGPCAFLVGPDLPHTYQWDPPPGRREHQCLVLQVAPELIERLRTFPEAASLAPLLRTARGGAAISGAPAMALWDLLARFPRTAPLRRLSLVIDAFAVLAEGQPRPIAAPPRRRAATPMGKVLEWIQAHLDEPISLAALGRVAGIHPRSVSRAFRREVGSSVIDYVHLMRVGRACDLLASSQREVVDCCFAAGFGNLAHFNRVFRRITGYTPTAYRRLLRR